MERTKETTEKRLIIMLQKLSHGLRTLKFFFLMNLIIATISIVTSNLTRTGVFEETIHFLKIQFAAPWHFNPFPRYQFR